MSLSDFQQFIADSRAYHSWTKDMPYLESRNEWYVFVYNSKKGKSSAYFTHIDSDAKYVGIGWTKSRIYNILSIQNGTKNHHLAHPSGTDRILGEIWKIPTEMVPDLDSEERNLYIANRIMIPVIGPGKVEYPCWMYITDTRYLVKGGVKIAKYSNYTHYGTDRFLEIA